MTSATQNRSTLHWLSALVAAAALACALFASGHASLADAAPKKCTNATATLETATKKQIRDGVECLIAKARKHAGRHVLAENVATRAISRRHANKMIKANCFKHVCNGEGTIPSRLKKSGYLDGASTYGFGENTGCATTPKAMVKAWLESDYHRRNLLGAKFRDIGIGVAKGAPAVQTACQAKGFMTFSVLFTWRQS